MWLHVQVVGSGRSVACRCPVQASTGTRGDGGRSFRPKRSKFVDQFRFCFAIGRCLLRGRVDHLGHPPLYETFKQGCVGRRERSWLAPFEGARIRHTCMHACVHSRPGARTRPFTGCLPIGHDAAAVAPSAPSSFIVAGRYPLVLSLCEPSCVCGVVLHAHKGTKARGGESYAL